MKSFVKGFSALLGKDSAAPQFLDHRFDHVAWLKAVRSDTRLFPTYDAQAIQRLKLAYPCQVESTVEAANRLLLHQFNLLGSGPYIPVDADRQSTDAYQLIDWNLDPVSGLRFPPGIHHKEWDLWKMRPGNADVKLPWELARCQHWPTLAQAWLLTGETHYADELFRQRADFDDANPVGYGIQWTCTMDIAIRAANWALALEMIRGHNAPEAQWVDAYRSLYAHGRFIRSNLEDRYEVTSNHFLSNVVGLYYLARVFHESSEAQEWATFSRNAIEREIDIQILPDGADFESSVPYHRLVTELFLGAIQVAEHAREPFSKHLKKRVLEMVEFVIAVLRIDGRLPQIGDADDGRLHILTDYGVWEPQDATHLLASAGAVYKTAWIAMAGKKGGWEAFWWNGEVAIQPENTGSGTLPKVTRYFPDAGIIVHRSDITYLLITNGIVGTKGFGNHKHNDLLSFEYHSGGTPLIVDPGSYVYTSDLPARNLFRGTGYHNTLMIDGVEQNETNPDWIFRLFEKATPEILEYTDSAESLVFRGRHHGYARLDSPVSHERRMVLEKKTGSLHIEDRLNGIGEHTLRWHFHLAPGIEVELQNSTLHFSQNGRALPCIMKFPARLQPLFSDAWYSPSYGVRIQCRAIEFELTFRLKDTALWQFAIKPLELA